MILTQSMVSVTILLMVFMPEANTEPQRWRGPPGYGQQFWPGNMYNNYRVAKPNHPGEFRPDTSRPVNHPPNWPPPKDRYRSGYGYRGLKPSGHPGVCAEPAWQDTGMCHALIPLWTYDQKTRKCKPFKYSGCGGNGNQFSSKKECEETCGAECGVYPLECADCEEKECWNSDYCVWDNRQPGFCKVKECGDYPWPQCEQCGYKECERSGKCVWDYPGLCKPKGKCGEYRQCEDCTEEDCEETGKCTWWGRRPYGLCESKWNNWNNWNN